MNHPDLMNPRAILPSLLFLGCLANLSLATENPAVTVNEFIYDKASFPSCHASTIAETPQGLIAAWFGGTDEGNDDVGIWTARRVDGKWTAPVEVANGVESASKRYPCWNPALFQLPHGPLLLFYKVGPTPKRWWGMLVRSTDGGLTWSKPERLPEGMLGPIKDKPILYQGDLVCPSSTEHDGWKAHIERTPDAGKTWTKTESLGDPKQFGVIQPTMLVHAGDKLQILCRSQQRKIVESWSEDGGKTWSPLAATSLPNPNSGFDAVNLPDGRILMIYNHTPRGRSPLNLALSTDGKQWQAAAVLEKVAGEYSYPAIISTADGKVHITYTWNRKKIKYLEVDPAKLTGTAIVDGVWPK